MKRILLYTALGLAVILLGLIGYYFWKPKPVALGFRTVDFSKLPGWETADAKKSLRAFQISCKAFLKQNPEKIVGSRYFHLQAKDWHPVCEAALRTHVDSSEKAKEFFQEWFTPVEIHEGKPVRGLFTGYYMSSLRGSLTKTDEFQVPLYGVPDNLVTVDLGLFDPELRHRRLSGRLIGNKLVPFYTRKEINGGVIAGHARVLAWVNSKIDRSFLEIQGSGVVQLADGTPFYVGYAGQNGAQYTAIAKVLIDKGVMTRDNASMQRIRKYLETNPTEIDTVLNKNKSFVFFEPLKSDAALGSQGVALTPGYSLAVDMKWIPLGVPIWLSTERPIEHSSKQKTFQRLMIAQDTGGAIRGVVRGDVYWGAGDHATAIAGKMKNPGHYWLLFPRHAITQLHVEAHK